MAIITTDSHGISTVPMVAHSTPGHALWCEDWRCPTCGSEHKGSDEEATRFLAPLHNPLYCSQKGKHPMSSCHPIQGAKLYCYTPGIDEFDDSHARPVGVVA